MPFRVNTRQCATCIFSSRSPIPPERFAELRAAWAADDTVQQCHDSTLRGGDVGCRGHYEAARRGDLPHPLTGIAETMGLGGLPLPQMMDLCENMGWVEFVDVDETLEKRDP